MTNHPSLPRDSQVLALKDLHPRKPFHLRQTGMVGHSGGVANGEEPV